MPSAPTLRVGIGFVQVVDRARQRGEVEDRVDRAVDVDVVGDVVLDEVEAPVAEQVGDVARMAGRQVVERDDVVAIGQQPVRQVRADEAGPAGDDDAPHAQSPRTAGRPTA